MSKMITWLLIGGIAIGAGFLLLTPEGRRMMHSIQAGVGGYDDPYKFYAGNEDAWDPTSARYKDIVARTGPGSQKQVTKKYQSVDDYYDEY